MSMSTDVPMSDVPMSDMPMSDMPMSMSENVNDMSNAINLDSIDEAYEENNDKLYQIDVQDDVHQQLNKWSWY